MIDTNGESMLRKVGLVVAFACLALPAVLSAQLSVGARAGLLGVGPEVAYGISEMLALTVEP